MSRLPRGGELISIKKDYQRQPGAKFWQWCINCGVGYLIKNADLGFDRTSCFALSWNLGAVGVVPDLIHVCCIVVPALLMQLT